MLDQDNGIFPPLDEAVLTSSRPAGVVDTASLLSGISDSLQPLGGLGTALSEFTGLTSFGPAPAVARIELPIPRLPNIAEVVGQPLLDELGTCTAELSNVQSQVLSLSETVNSVLQSSAANTLGLMGGINVAQAALSVAEPQITNWASVATCLSSMADVFQPLASHVRQLHVGLAPVLERLPTLIAPLPTVDKMAGALVPLAQMTGALAPDGFAIPVGLARMMQEICRTLPSLENLIGGHVADLFAGVGSVADWAKRLKPPVFAEARYAYDAYRKGDTEPMKAFLRRCLRLWPVMEDHCQALAVAMIERAWEQEVDLTDDRSVRRVLTRYARQGCDFERDHQIGGVPIGYIPDGWEQRDTVPGPEDLVLPRLVPWDQHFEADPVRDVLGRFNEQELAVVRAWSENYPIPWTEAPALVQQDKAQGEHNRRKLKALSREWRQNNRQEPS
ncbi:hypothetical protein ACFRAI_22300 [Streptomyces sp. NPDC056637]|uniref:hypothetical protein n=1 Tax=unclassified Streptomyces TaxID=2593676 RepID=UPI0036835175